jgi:hypothetical protein
MIRSHWKIIEKEASSGKKIQVEEKGTNTNLVNIKTQENSNPIEEKTYKDVGVQTMEIPSIPTNKKLAINKTTPGHEEEIIPRVNGTSTIRESHARRIVKFSGQFNAFNFRSENYFQVTSNNKLGLLSLNNFTLKL